MPESDAQERQYAVRKGRYYQAPIRRHRLRTAGVVTLAGAAALVAGQGWLVRPQVETALHDSVAKALTDAGHPSVSVAVHGRDIDLSDVPRGEAATVTSVVQQVPGVFRISHVTLADSGDQTDVATGQGASASPTAGPSASISPSASAPASPSPTAASSNVAVADLATVSALVDDNKVTVFGAVPDREQRTKLLDALAATFGTDNVTSKLSLRDGAGTTGLSEFPAVVSALGASTRAGLVSLRAGRVTVVGTTTDDVTAAVRTAAQAVPGTDPAALSLTLTTADDADTAPATDAEVARLLSAFPAVTFTSNSSRIRPESQRVITAAGQLLQAHPNVSVMVEGHTDSNGVAQDNLQLSVDRAAAVRAALIDAGGGRAQVSSRGLGDTKPLAGGTGDVADELNRRVVLVATAG